MGAFALAVLPRMPVLGGHVFGLELADRRWKASERLLASASSVTTGLATAPYPVMNAAPRASRPTQFWSFSSVWISMQVQRPSAAAPVHPPVASFGDLFLEDHDLNIPAPGGGRFPMTQPSILGTEGRVKASRRVLVGSWPSRHGVVFWRIRRGQRTLSLGPGKAGGPSMFGHLPGNLEARRRSERSASGRAVAYKACPTTARVSAKV